MVLDFLSPSMEHHIRALEMGPCSPELRMADGDNPEVLKFLHREERLSRWAGPTSLSVLLSVSEQAWVLVLVGGGVSLLFVLQPENGYNKL